jgi:hypothetical protein
MCRRRVASPVLFAHELVVVTEIEGARGLVQARL